MNLRDLVKRSETITGLYRRLQFRRSAQEAWEGVPPAYRALPIGRIEIGPDLADWEAHRDKVKEIVIRCLGELPPRPSPLAVRTLSTDQKDQYRIEKFVFDNGVGFEVPGYIAIPGKRSGPLAAILAMHGHAADKENLFGYKPSSQTVAEMLVRRGYAVIGIDNYFTGERRGTGPAGRREMQDGRSDQELSLFKLNLWLGRSLWGMMLRDWQIVLDYLESRPEVDRNRIGAQGMSMGSTGGWWLGAIDDRVKAVVGVACFTRYEELIAMRQLSAHDIYYFVPGILRHFDSEAVMALLAPRPFLALTGDRDPGSPVDGMRKLEAILAPLYRAYGKAEAFQSVIYPNTGHLYSNDMKQKMMDWFDKFL